MLIVLLMILTGCSLPNSYVAMNDTMWRDTIIRVQIDDNYVIDRSHPYDLLDVEDGIDVTVHFVKRELPEN